LRSEQKSDGAQIKKEQREKAQEKKIMKGAKNKIDRRVT
jgi:hypothetical protein